MATTDGGATWTAQFDGNPWWYLHGVSCPSATQCVAVGEAGKIAATTDGGTTWAQQNSGATTFLHGVSCATTSQCVAVGDGGTILTTANGGSTWTSEQSGVTSTLRGVTCESAAQCLAVGDGGVILVSTNGGLAWAPESSGTTNRLNAASCASTTNCWVVGWSAILSTTNGGATWNLESNGPPSTSDSFQAVSCRSDSHCVVTGGNGDILTNGTGNACGLGTAPPPPTIPSVTAAPQTSAWEQQYAVAERTMFGLDASSTAVSNALSDPSATSDDLGSPLTSAESSQLHAEEALGENVAAVSQAAETALPNSFAGAWFDYSNGGTVYAAFTSTACPTSAEVTQLEQVAGTTVIPVAAANDITLMRLDALQTSIDNETAALEQLGIVVNTTSLDVQGNQVLVTLDPASASNSESVMTTQFGASGLAFTPSAPPAEVNEARFNPSQGAPVFGGQDITDNHDARCTANISIMNQATGNYYAMSAGHCFPQADSISQNGASPPSYNGDPTPPELRTYAPAKSIGNVKSTPVSNGARMNCDCEAIGPIPKSQATGGILIGGENILHLNAVAYQDKYFVARLPACESGMTTYYVYGHPICGRIDFYNIRAKETDRNDPAAWTNGWTWTVNNMFSVKYPPGVHTQPGDSGGPVYNRNQGLLLGFVEDAVDASRAKNFMSVYPGSDWVIPHD